MNTERYDVGGTAQALVKGRYVLTARGAAAWQRHDHRFGDILERDAHDTLFGEVALRGASGAHTWVSGVVYERDDYQPRDVPQFAYTYDVPGIFAEDDFDVRPWMSVSLGARVDVHNEYGTFFSPRVAALFRGGPWVSRVAVGQGFFASTALTEETEAAGLSRLRVIGELEAERGTSFSADLTRQIGVASITATFFTSRVADAVGVERETDYTLFNRAEALDQYRDGAAHDLARGGLRRHRLLHLRAIARDGDRWPPGRTADAPAQRRDRRHVGAGTRRGTGGPGGLLHRGPAPRSQPVPHGVPAIRGHWPARRAALRPVPPLHQRREPRRHRQTRWDSVIRPTQGADGRWTVDAWAPLEGRVFNGGVRLEF